jgi:hypothetical protein
VTYLGLNSHDEAATVYWPHGEVEGKPGYTGRWSGDRAAATGYPWSAGWEVISLDNDPAVGYPITIQSIAYVALDVTQAELHDGNRGAGGGLSKSIQLWDGLLCAYPDQPSPESDKLTIRS